MNASVSSVESSNEKYTEAILVAEELVEVLTSEQAKYENVDEDGNTVEPLAKELIAELEQRRERLVLDAQATTQ